MRSIGAVMVFATAPDTPPNKKSIANFEASGMADKKQEDHNTEAGVHCLEPK